MQASIPLGTVVGGRWQVSGVLGEGGFGQVLLAEDTSEVGLGEAAVKVLHPNTTPQERQDFLTEVKKIAALRHPNLVGYLDSGQLNLNDEIRPYLVTERCALSLSDHARRSPTGTLSGPETLAVLADLAAGLAHLHEKGLIHRDIKPGNALWSDGRWKLADFGLMRDLSATGSYHRAGTLMGTPLFMAPELFATMQATPASDLYAMGVLAHLCATGAYVHTGVGPVLMHNVATLPPTLDPALPPTLVPIVARCTHPDPTMRPSAEELLHLVRMAQSGQIVPGAPIRAPVAPATTVTPFPGPMPVDDLLVAPASGPATGSTAAPRVLVLMAGALGGLLLVAALGAGLLALTGGLGGDDDSTPTTTISSTTISTTTISTTTIGDLGVVADPETHLLTPACEGADPAPVVEVENRHATPVDYLLTTHHFDAAGVRIGEYTDTVSAIPPGQRALLRTVPVEEGAVTCEVAELTARPVDPALVSDGLSVAVTGCTLDEFFGNYYDVTFTVTNPYPYPVDVDIDFAVVDAEGVTIDQGIGATVPALAPGQTAQDATGDFYNNVEFSPRPVAGCTPGRVEFTETS